MYLEQEQNHFSKFLIFHKDHFHRPMEGEFRFLQLLSNDSNQSQLELNAKKSNVQTIKKSNLENCDLKENC